MKKRIIALLISTLLSVNCSMIVSIGDYHAGLGEIEQINKTKGVYTYEVNVVYADKGFTLVTKKHYKEDVDYIIIYKHNKLIKIVRY